MALDITCIPSNCNYNINNNNSLFVHNNTINNFSFLNHQPRNDFFQNLDSETNSTFDVISSHSKTSCSQSHHSFHLASRNIDNNNNNLDSQSHITSTSDQTPTEPTLNSCNNNLFHKSSRSKQLASLVAMDLRRAGVNKKWWPNHTCSCCHNRGIIRNHMFLKKVQNSQISKGIVFGMELCRLPTVAIGDIVVPKFLYEMTCHLEGSIEIRGLFRRSGSITRIKMLQEKVNEGGGVPVDCDPVDVACLLKQFLRSLRSPLVSPSLHQLLFHIVTTVSMPPVRTNLILKCCLLMPPTHLASLKLVTELLHNISARDIINRMDVYNLAVCLAPCLFAAPLGKMWKEEVVIMETLISRHYDIAKMDVAMVTSFCLNQGIQRKRTYKKRSHFKLKEKESNENNLSILEETKEEDEKEKSKKKTKRSIRIIKNKNKENENFHNFKEATRKFSSIKKSKANKSQDFIDSNFSFESTLESEKRLTFTHQPLNMTTPSKQTHHNEEPPSFFGSQRKNKFFNVFNSGKKQILRESLCDPKSEQLGGIKNLFDKFKKKHQNSSKTLASESMNFSRKMNFLEDKPFRNFSFKKRNSSQPNSTKRNTLNLNTLVETKQKYFTLKDPDILSHFSYHPDLSSDLNFDRGLIFGDGISLNDACLDEEYYDQDEEENPETENLNSETNTDLLNRKEGANNYVTPVKQLATQSLDSGVELLG